MMEPKGEPWQEQAIGSTWVRVMQNTGSYGPATTRVSNIRGAGTWRGSAVKTWESAEGTLLQAPNGDFVAIVKGDTPLVTWDPPAGYAWPLTIGKSWSRKLNVTFHAAKRTIPVEVTSTVEAYEEVTVPAGMFKAFKVRSIDNQGNEDLNWYSPELGIFVKQSLRRTARHSAGPGTRETVIESQTIRR